MPFDVQRDHLSAQALRVPARWRHRPFTSALWRMLMVDVASLRAVAGDRSADPLDVVAARLVLAAIGGDIRAINMIANLIDGPVRRRIDEPPSDGSQSVERERVIAKILKALAS
jgi:hypothetical protein